MGRRKGTKNQWNFDEKNVFLIISFESLIKIFDFNKIKYLPDPILNIDPWLEHSTSFGFPSGHTQIAVVIWLYIAMNVKNSIAKIF